MNYKEPTIEQCSNREKVFENDTKIGYACCYPQMGGYVGKAIAILDKEWIEYSGGSAIGGCIDVYVWHDGEFPFSEQDGPPAKIHHCDPAQFIRFGQFLQEMNNRNKIEE